MTQLGGEVAHGLERDILKVDVVMNDLGFPVVKLCPKNAARATFIKRGEHRVNGAVLAWEESHISSYAVIRAKGRKNVEIAVDDGIRCSQFGLGPMNFLEGNDRMGVEEGIEKILFSFERRGAAS